MSKLEIVERVDGKYPFRVYSMSNGENYPSVTSITGLIHEQDILAWRRRVGNAKANEISSTASRHGTRFHTLMEEKMLGGNPQVDFSSEFYSVYDALKKEIYPKISNVKFVEKQLFSSTLRCAGTVDLLADWEGETAIIDWKTTRREKTLSDVDNYFAQLACYAYMIRENYGIVAKNMVLVFDVNDEYVYTLNQTDIQKWVDYFVQWRKEFYKRNGV